MSASPATTALDCKIPRGCMLFTDALDRIHRAITPDHKTLAQEADDPAIRCLDQDEVNPSPWTTAPALQRYRQARAFAHLQLRELLLSGELESYTRDPCDGQWLLLPRQDWLRHILSDEEPHNFPRPDDPINPGPDCAIRGVPQAVFMLRRDVDKTLVKLKLKFAANDNGDRRRPGRPAKFGWAEMQKFVWQELEHGGVGSAHLPTLQALEDKLRKKFDDRDGGPAPSTLKARLRTMIDEWRQSKETA
jgi:hypothetical protein